MKYIVTVDKLEYCSDGVVESMINFPNIVAEVTDKSLANKVAAHYNKEYTIAKVHEVMEDDDVLIDHFKLSCSNLKQKEQ